MSIYWLIVDITEPNTVHENKRQYTRDLTTAIFISCTIKTKDTSKAKITTQYARKRVSRIFIYLRCCGIKTQDTFKAKITTKDAIKRVWSLYCLRRSKIMTEDILRLNWNTVTIANPVRKWTCYLTSLL